MSSAGARYSAGNISGHTPALQRAQYCTTFGLFVFLPGVFLSSRVTGACPVTTDLIM